MDPVTAFSLAAGVLQVVDVSLKALSKCREIYKDGSLAQHRHTKEVTKALAETSERLRSSVHSSSNSRSRVRKDVIEVSQNCSATAEELLSELKKLKLDRGDGFLKAMRTGVRAMQRKKFLTEIEERLQKYQTILNTRILSRLDVHAIQQIEKSQQLDESVKNLATALSQGHNTVKKLLSDQTGIIKHHIDRRFEDQAQREAKQRACQLFKKSLFYPEIFARQDDIPRSHDGTCRWIFEPLERQSSRHSRAVSSESSEGTDNDSGRESDDDYSQGDNATSLPEYYVGRSSAQRSRVRNESSFVHWLRRGKEAYWLSGKPGAGKSTLMKYISIECPKFHQSEFHLPRHHGRIKFITCSFFFWNLGTPLQKNYVGFLRSILYQIAEQQEDAIPIMMTKGTTTDNAKRAGRFEEYHEIYAWTRERLEDALSRFLLQKPASFLVHFFIDGLDEFFGDEDSLIQTIHQLAHTPRTYVCVSSRPEQIFRQGFAKSPQLRLQDLNHCDIEKATWNHLGPMLHSNFQDSPRKVDTLIEDVIEKSQGIFLWADLMSKVIKRGTNDGDSLQELQARLSQTPDTIEGLYRDMLSRMDKEHSRDAAKYMQMMLVGMEEIYYIKRPDLTLLHFACLEQATWDHKMSDDATYEKSTEFDRFCRKLETRMLARCGGLIEIVEGGCRSDIEAIEMLGIDVSERVEADVDVGLSSTSRNGDRGSITRNLRPVRFIHKSAADFIRKHDDFFKDSKWLLAATRAVTQSIIEALALAPLMLHENMLQTVSIDIKTWSLKPILTALPLLETRWPSEEDQQLIRNLSFDMINRTFDIADYVYTSLRVPNSAFASHNTYPIIHMDKNRLGCAVYLGCHDYVQRCLVPSSCTEKVAGEVIDCALDGLTFFEDPLEGLIPMITGLFKIILDFVPQSRSEFWQEHGTGGWPRWLRFLVRSLPIVVELLSLRKQSLCERGDELVSLQQTSQFLTTWKLVFESILSHYVDVDYVLTVTLTTNVLVTQPGDMILVRMNESILSAMKREFTTLDPVFAEDVVRLLETHGAADRRDGVLIGSGGRYPSRLQLHRLTEAQSEKLWRMPLERLFDTSYEKRVNIADVVDLQSAGQSSPRAEELMQLLCQGFKYPGSVFRRVREGCRRPQVGSYF